MTTSFTTHSTGQVITAADVNLIQTAVNALENAPAGGVTGVWSATDHGINSWNFDPAMSSQSSNVTNVGTPYYQGLHVKTGNLTKIYADCSATGTATHYACLYDASGNLLQQSAGLVPSSLGLTTWTISTQAVTDGKYMVMVYGSSASGTIASFRRVNTMVNGVANLGLTTPYLRSGTGSQTTLTTTAPSTTGTLTQNGIMMWVAVGP